MSGTAPPPNTSGNDGGLGKLISEAVASFFQRGVDAAKGPVTAAAQQAGSQVGGAVANAAGAPAGSARPVTNGGVTGIPASTVTAPPQKQMQYPLVTTHTTQPLGGHPTTPLGGHPTQPLGGPGHATVPLGGAPTTPVTPSPPPAPPKKPPPPAVPPPPTPSSSTSPGSPPPTQTTTTTTAPSNGGGTGMAPAGPLSPAASTTSSGGGGGMMGGIMKFLGGVFGGVSNMSAALPTTAEETVGRQADWYRISRAMTGTAREATAGGLRGKMFRQMEYMPQGADQVIGSAMATSGMSGANLIKTGQLFSDQFIGSGVSAEAFAKGAHGLTTGGAGYSMFMQGINTLNSDGTPKDPAKLADELYVTWGIGNIPDVQTLNVQASQGLVAMNLNTLDVPEETKQLILQRWRDKIQAKKMGLKVDSQKFKRKTGQLNDQKNAYVGSAEYGRAKTRLMEETTEGRMGGYNIATTAASKLNEVLATTAEKMGVFADRLLTVGTAMNMIGGSAEFGFLKSIPVIGPMLGTLGKFLGMGGGGGGGPNAVLPFRGGGGPGAPFGVGVGNTGNVKGFGGGGAGAAIGMAASSVSSTSLSDDTVQAIGKAVGSVVGAASSASLPDNVADAGSSGDGDDGGEGWEGDAPKNSAGQKKKAEYIYKRLRDAGMDHVGAAAILGNLEIESGFDTTAVNPTSGATGLAQWLDVRLDRLNAFLNKTGQFKNRKGPKYSKNSLEGQVEFLLWESKAGGTHHTPWVNTKKAGSIGEASQVWQDTWEVAVGQLTQERKDAAKTWGKQFKGSYSEGAWMVTQGQEARLHGGEMVLPADVARSVRRAMAENQAGGPGNTTVNMNITFNRATKEEADWLVDYVAKALRQEKRLDRLGKR